MRTYLYIGPDRTRAVSLLALSVAGLQQPTCVASFGQPKEDNLLALRAGSLPIDVVHVRLPGLGLWDSHAYFGEVATQTVLAVLRQVISSGDYRLVILDGIRDAINQGLLAENEVKSLVACAPEDTEIAMT